jgi:hypothetical protein
LPFYKKEADNDAMIGAGRRKKKVREMTPQDLASAPDSIVIAWNFIRIRKSLGLTQQKASDLGETTVGYVGKIETAAVGFGTRAQKKWSRLFNKTADGEWVSGQGLQIKIHVPREAYSMD